MGLQGILETFALSDVLRLLAATRKTGCLHIEGDRGRGNVWLYQGGLMEATVDGQLAGRQTRSEVLFELLRVEEGSFEFAAADYPEAHGGEFEDLESTLQQASRLLTEWRELATVVPSLSHRVVIASQLHCERITLDADLWTVLASIADRPTISEVARRLNLGELAVTRAICDLVGLGVAVVEPPGAAHLPTAGHHEAGHRDAGHSAVNGESSNGAPALVAVAAAE